MKLGGGGLLGSRGCWLQLNDGRISLASIFSIMQRNLCNAHARGEGGIPCTGLTNAISTQTLKLAEYAKVHMLLWGNRSENLKAVGASINFIHAKHSSCA